MIHSVKNILQKLLGIGLVLLFVGLGIVGIVLPVLPGLLFLFIAALIAARHFPALSFLMEKSSYSREALRISNGFMDLGLWDKTKLCCLGTIKLTIDGIEWTVRLGNKTVKYLLGRLRSRQVV